MFAEFDIQVTVFMTTFIILSIWNILTQISIFIKNKEFIIKSLLLLVSLTSAFILTLVYLMPMILKQMMEYSTGVPMFSTLDVIKNSLIISLLITLGISLIFLIPFIHTYIYDLSFIQKARPILYIILIIVSMVITPTGDAFTMMATLVPMSLGTEIGLYQCKKRTEE
jgi:Sec-independent protein secretion pathway component TatC